MVVWTYLELGRVISAVVGGVALDGIDSNSPVTGPPSMLTAALICLEGVLCSLFAPYDVYGSSHHESLSL